MTTVNVSTGRAAVLWRNGIRSVRIMWTMSVCVSRPWTNHPLEKEPVGSVFAPKMNHMTANIVRSKNELIGPMHTMNRAMLPAGHLPRLPHPFLVHPVPRNGNLGNIVEEVLNEQLNRRASAGMAETRSPPAR